MARKRKGRSIDGLLLLNKSTGESSNASLQKVKRLFQAAKAGHTGSLDPLATGMLPICLGEATKFSQFLLNADKAYRVTAKLGERTETSDSEGKIVETRKVDVSKQQLLDVIDKFRGDTLQVPSMYSALKHNGQPLYKLARQGIEVERQPRPITIYAAELVSFDAPYLVMDVECSKGTYIRTLIDDIGELLGCGAHVTALHRSWVAAFDANEMVTFEELSELNETEGLDALDGCLLEADTAVLDFPEANLTAEMSDYILHGQPILVPKSPQNGLVRLYNHQHQFIGVGEVNDDGLIAPKRLISTAPE